MSTDRELLEQAGHLLREIADALPNVADCEKPQVDLNRLATAIDAHLSQPACAGEPGECAFNGACMYACGKSQPDALQAAAQPVAPNEWRLVPLTPSPEQLAAMRACGKSASSEERYCAAIAATPPAGERSPETLPVAYLRSITHPDWLELCGKDDDGAFPVFAGERSTDETMTLQEVWEAAGGNPGITPTKDGVLFALQTLDEVCDEAGERSTPAEPPAWRDHVEQRLLTWRQRFMNRSGDQLALDDFMDKESLDDLIDFVCDEWSDPISPHHNEGKPA